MPRPPRIRVPGIPLHVVQRGNNRCTTFFEDGDYREYLSWLEHAAERYAVSVHAYVLMTNHVHLLLTAESRDGISRALQLVGSRYTRRINVRHERTGGLWEGRFWSSPIDSERYALACYRYIELNPVRAGIVRDPADYPWSSYRVNSTGKRSFVTPHPALLSLAVTPQSRNRLYRELVSESLSEETLHKIRRSLRKGLPTGDEPFKERLEGALGRRIGTGRPGPMPKIRRD